MATNDHRNAGGGDSRPTAVEAAGDASIHILLHRRRSHGVGHLGGNGPIDFRGSRDRMRSLRERYSPGLPVLRLERI
jgi:hypothetical protein